MSMNVRVGGAWKDISAVSVRVGGAWKTVSQAYVRAGGVWEELLGSAITLSFVASSTSSAATISIPGSAQAGDLAVLLDVAGNASSTVPTTVAPSGFTSRLNTSGSGAGTIRARGVISTKVLVGGDAGASITGMDDTEERKTLLVFRPSSAISSITAGSANGVVQSSLPSAQVVTASGQAGPLVLVGHYYSTGGTPSLSASPAFTGSVGNNRQPVGYTLQTSGADQTITPSGGSSSWFLQSLYLQVS